MPNVSYLNINEAKVFEIMGLPKIKALLSYFL